MTTIPSVRVRFSNPNYNPATKKYKLDVDFTCDTPGQALFGMNVRFMYDATKLLPGTNTNGKVNLIDFAPGYGMQNKASCGTGTMGVALFGLATAPMTYVNWAVQLNNPAAEPVIMPTEGWVKLFSVETETPNVLDAGSEFTPVFIWDAQDKYETKAYIGGDGNVITLVSARTSTVGSTTSKPAKDYADHWNWVDFPGSSVKPFGKPTYVVV